MVYYKALLWIGGASILLAVPTGFYLAGRKSQADMQQVVDAKSSTIAAQAQTIHFKDKKISALDLRIYGLSQQLVQAKDAAQADERIVFKTRTLEVARDQIIAGARQDAGLDAPVNPDLVFGLRVAWCGLYDPAPVSTAGDRDGAATDPASGAGNGGCAAPGASQTLKTNRDVVEWWVGDQVESILSDTRRSEVVELIKGPEGDR